jgi:hypothetical protein
VLPPQPTDGQIVNIQTSRAITAFTLSPNAGQTIVNAPTTLAAGQRIRCMIATSGGGAPWFVSN